MQHPICAHRGFLILSFQKLLLILCLMEQYVFYSSVHLTLATTCENCLLYANTPTPILWLFVLCIEIKKPIGSKN